MNAHKVIWTEGMLLRPQHFQHSDRYHDHQLKTRTCLIGRFNWGFATLEIDLQMINQGKLIVGQASGILPDGTLFSIDGNSEPLALDVPPNTGRMAVYLALPLITGNHIEARLATQSSVLARYTTYQQDVADSNASDDSVCPIACGRPDFRLLLGEHKDDQAYVKLKVCEILGSSPDGKITLEAGFFPTYIHAHASSYLLSCLKEVLSLVDSRGDAMAERIRSNGKAGGAEVGDFLMLQLINRTGLVLHHYMGLAQLHPEELFATLLSLLGELSTFATDTKRPRADVHYQHSDQGTSFRKLMEAIREVLSMVLEQHAIELMLDKRQYGVQVAPLHDLTLLGDATFVIAATAQCDGEQLRQKLPAHLKVGALDHIRHLVNLHLPGIRLRPLPVAPRQIPFHADKTYFSLDLSPEDIAQVKGSGSFAFHVSGAFPGLELRFWAIRK